MTLDEKRIEELTKVGKELYHRSEQWRNALLEIRKVNDNPVIELIIKQQINM